MKNSAWSSARHPRVGHQPTIPLRPEKTVATRILDAVCFVIPFIMSFTVIVVGSLMFSEVLTLILLVPCVIVSWKKTIWRGFNKPVLILMGLWLLGQIVGDFYNHSPLEKAARGQALIVFFAIDFIVLTTVIRGKERRILYFASGLVAGKILATYLW